MGKVANPDRISRRNSSNVCSAYSRTFEAQRDAKMIFTNSDLSGGCVTSSSDASTPCDVEMVPMLGSHEEAGGMLVPEVGAVEEAGTVMLLGCGSQEVPVLEAGDAGALLWDATAVPLTVVGVEAADDLVAIDLVAVSAVTTTAELYTPTTEAAISTVASFLSAGITDQPLDLSTPTRERISLALELATTQASETSTGGGRTEVDPCLAEAVFLAATTGEMTPIIKEELKCTIQNKRLSEGKEELMVEEFRQPTAFKLTPEDERRRLQRRDRNRLAAQRCRKRRSDKGDELEEETQVLEKKNKLLVDDIAGLERERAKLEAMLLAHDTKAICRGSCRERLSTSSVEDDAMSGDT